MRLNRHNKRPELVSPAGDWCALVTAVEAGADSVYFGVKSLNMRREAGNFDVLELDKIMSFLREKNKKGYLALNSIIYNHESEKVEGILKNAAAAGVNAVILWDMAVLSAAKKAGIPVHLSTQASVSNFSALRFYYSQGVKRVVPARECTLDDISEIIRLSVKEKIDCEIETFIHGALCLSVSGRCLISHYADSKPANRGECVQPCRREYLITDVNSGGNQYVLGRDYLLSPKDLCCLGFLERLIESGITAFKIEGRARSPEYVKEVTSVYREAIDSCFAGNLKERLADLTDRLKRVYNRGFSSGFFFGTPDDLGSDKGTSAYKKIFLGEIESFYPKKSVAALTVKNRGLSKGDDIVIYGKSTPVSGLTVREMEIDHNRVDRAGKGERVALKVPFRVRRRDKVFILSKK